MGLGVSATDELMVMTTHHTLCIVSVAACNVVRHKILVMMMMLSHTVARHH